MRLRKEEWTPIPMHCANCGQLNYGYRNEEGKIKYECTVCGITIPYSSQGMAYGKQQAGHNDGAKN